MGTQNILNYYFNRLDAKLDYSSYHDFYLAADEVGYNQEVVYSDNVIGYNNGNVLPLWIDLNSTGSSTQPTLTGVCDNPQMSIEDNSTTGTPQTIISLNYWGKAVSSCDCPYTAETAETFTIPNINLTGIDNGLLTGMTTGQTLTLYDDLPESLKFDRLSYGKNMKMHQVSASTYSPNNISYTISSSTDNSGYYQQLNGGFYQGFYNLYGYPYNILPDRPDLGWTVETFLKLRATGSTSGGCFTTHIPKTSSLNTCNAPHSKSLNDVYDNNSGLFYYVGTRAENKFHSDFTTESSCTSFSGINCCNAATIQHALGPAVASVSPVATSTGGTAGTITLTAETHDTFSNALGLRLTPDFKLGYRALRFTGSCITTGTTSGCTTGTTFGCGYTIEEEYSETICPTIINSGDSCEDTWIHVAAVFDRDFPLISGSSCDVGFQLGGIFDLLYLFSGITTAPIQDNRCDNVFDEFPLIPEDGYYDFDCAGISGQTDDNCCYSAGTPYGTWLTHDEYREGTLTLYANGRRVLKIDNFKEIIPRALNQHRDLQVGVPFNMSWGGGTQGLYESMAFSGETSCSGDPPYQQDPNDLGLLIEKNFAGSFIGGISQLRYYIEPLQADAIYHNFLINKDRYSLVDCDFQKNCTTKSCNQSQVLYLREGNSFDVKGVFGNLSDNLYFDTNGDSVKFSNYTQENISSVKFYKNTTERSSDKEVTTPFYLNSTDTVEMVITKMDSDINAIVTLIGNLYK